MTPDAGPGSTQPDSEWSQPTLRTVYEQGSVPDWHGTVIERAADVAVAAMPIPLRVLDVGCGSGELLDELILRVPYADIYVGVDPVPAARRTSDPHVCLVRAAAESLPFPGASFDLVVTTMSLAYWVDQRAGAAELARVVAENGKVIVVESLRRNSDHPGRPHGAKAITQLLAGAGLRVERTEQIRRIPLLPPVARAFIASL